MDVIEALKEQSIDEALKPLNERQSRMCREILFDASLKKDPKRLHEIFPDLLEVMVLTCIEENKSQRLKIAESDPELSAELFQRNSLLIKELHRIKAR